MNTIVTIARSYGSGGKEIGKALAKALGVPYYGREIFEISQGDESGIYPGDDESIHKSSFGEADEEFKRNRVARKLRHSGTVRGSCAPRHGQCRKSLPVRAAAQLYAPRYTLVRA